MHYIRLQKCLQDSELIFLIHFLLLNTFVVGQRIGLMHFPNSLLLLNLQIQNPLTLVGGVWCIIVRLHWKGFISNKINHIRFSYAVSMTDFNFPFVINCLLQMKYSFITCLELE